MQKVKIKKQPMSSKWSSLLVDFLKREDNNIQEHSSTSFNEECSKTQHDTSNPLSLNTIPKFFYKVVFFFLFKRKKVNEVTEQNEASTLIGDLSREMLLDVEEDNLLTESDLDLTYQNLATLLIQHEETEYMTYEIFKQLKVSLPERVQRFFTTKVYRSFCGNAEGKIKIASFYKFLSLGGKLFF
ncbi:hypothetical protein RFI_06145 [Reticulomyxa filosa]|uniref:Uncharacterized protein n=1 Tax=Reticulomyxa filosa TaxID=46433 RepID=X6NYQ9_RETFI|nr:hypothetical protein RFI_06145 [Reticulomyxa filosa]|eukprot:ETO30974.1 hypothetical protein RFI_06145 [Reticulomyxa filosa]